MSIGHYTDWSQVNYQPSCQVLPQSLLDFLVPGQTALDLGCGTGEAALFLANRGLKVTGIDINPQAIETSQQKVRDRKADVSFQVKDILKAPPVGCFDVVMMIRLLTCFPALSDWQNLLAIARTVLKEHGLVYIYDFCLSPENPRYLQAYEEGQKSGWRPGNFPVRNKEGNLLFVAHHHDSDELAEITKAYETLQYHEFEGKSMHGNPVRAFEFLGRLS